MDTDFSFKTATNQQISQPSVKVVPVALVRITGTLVPYFEFRGSRPKRHSYVGECTPEHKALTGNGLQHAIVTPSCWHFMAF